MLWTIVAILLIMWLLGFSVFNDTMERLEHLFSVQQRFVAPSGDYNLATYSNVKLNPPMTADDLKLKLPAGVKREFPQK